MRATLAILAAFIGTLYLTGGGLPRLYGTGCQGRIAGFALAQQESDFLQPCRTVRRIWPTE